MPLRIDSESLSSIQQSFSTFGENYRYLCHKYKIMPYMFRSDFPIIIKQIHLYVDDHHGPHHEAVMVVSSVLLLMRIALLFLQLKRCVIWSNIYALYK